MLKIVTLAHLCNSELWELCWAEVENMELGCWGLCCQKMCPGEAYLAIPGKKFNEFFLIWLFFFFFHTWLSVALSLVALCTEELFRSKLAANKQELCYQMRHLFIQTIEDYPKDYTCESSLWFCANLFSQSLFQRSTPNNLFVMIPLFFIFPLHQFYFSKKCKNMELFHYFEFTCQMTSWLHSQRNCVDCTQEPFLLILIWSQIKGLEEYQRNTNLVKQAYSITVFISWFWLTCLQLQFARYFLEVFILQVWMIINAEMGVENPCFYLQYSEYVKHFHIWENFKSYTNLCRWQSKQRTAYYII